jgi:competence protein ComEC
MTPVLWAALGGAAAYYGLGFLRGGPLPWASLVWGLLAVFFVLLSLFRVLAEPRLWADPWGPYEVRRAGVILAALALGCCLGLGGRGAFSPRVDLGLPPGDLIGISGVLREDPRALDDDRGMGMVALRSVAGKNGLRASARGAMPVFFPPEAVPLLRTFGRGCEVYLEGELRASAGGAASAPYLFQASATHITKPAPAAEQFRTALRTGFLSRFNSFPWGGLAAALLLGVKDNLEGPLSRAFREAGCSHVLALSGMHLAILSSLIAFLLRKPLGLRPAALLGALFVILYVLLVGPQPSLVRAAIMYILGTLALLKALPASPLSLLGLSFLIQLFLDPASGDSPSFILSYLALGGILSAGEAIHDLGASLLPDALSRPLSASLGAFIATAPVSAAFFGELRPVGIFAGLLIVPLATVFMILALIYLAGSFIAPPLAPALGTILSLLYTALNRLSGFASRAPGIRVARSGLVLAVILVILALLLLLWRRRRKGRMALAPFEAG